MANLASATIEDLVKLGAPLSVAEEIVREREAKGSFPTWAAFLRRLCYAAPNETSAAVGKKRLGYPIVPEDHRLLQELGVTLSSSPELVTGHEPWWTDPLQRLGPLGLAPDDSFPVEFRGQPEPQSFTNLSSSQVECQFGFLFAQVQYADSNTYTYLGYALNRTQKEHLLARWAHDYPEMSESVLSSWDVPRDPASKMAAASGSSSPSPATYHELQARRYKDRCWDALSRSSAAAVPGPGSSSGGNAAVVPALPEWVGAPRPGQVAGTSIPMELRDQYRVDPYGNIVAADAEPNSICFWEVDHVFPRKRGGRSVPHNFAATHWYTERHVKTEKLLASILLTKDGRNPLTCGLTEAGLTALWQSRNLLPPALQPTSAFKQLLSSLLCSNWRRADYKYLFNTREGLLHVTPTAQLFSILLQEFQTGINTLVVGWHVGLLASSALALSGPVAEGQQADAPRIRRGSRPSTPPKPPMLEGKPPVPRQERRRASQAGDISSSAPTASVPKHRRTSSTGNPSGGSERLQRASSGGESTGLQVPKRTTSIDPTLSSNLPEGLDLEGDKPKAASRRVRMGSRPSVSPSPQAALRVYNQMVAMAQEADIPELMALPAMPPDPESPKLTVKAGGPEQAVAKVDAGTMPDETMAHAGDDAVSIVSSVHVMAADGACSPRDSLRKYHGLSSSGLRTRPSRQQQRIHDRDAGPDNATSDQNVRGMNKSKIKRETKDASVTTDMTGLDPMLVGEGLFNQLAAPPPILNKPLRSRMKSSTTQTQAGADANTSYDSAARHETRGQRTTSSPPVDRPEHRPPVTTPARHPYTYQGIVTWNALPLPPPMPPSTQTMQQALASSAFESPGFILPVYKPTFDPLAGRWPPRPRNPLADPYIAEAYDFSAAAAPGSSITSCGIIEQAIMYRNRAYSESGALRAAVDQQGREAPPKEAWGMDSSGTSTPQVDTGTFMGADITLAQGVGCTSYNDDKQGSWTDKEAGTGEQDGSAVHYEQKRVDQKHLVIGQRLGQVHAKEVGIGGSCALPNGQFWSPRLRGEVNQAMAAQLRRAGDNTKLSEAHKLGLARMAQPQPRNPPRLPPPPAPLTTSQLTDMRLRRWGRPDSGPPDPHTAVLRLPHDNGQLTVSEAALLLPVRDHAHPAYHHGKGPLKDPSPAPSTPAAFAVKMFGDAFEYAGKIATQAEYEHDRQLRNAWELAQVGVLSTTPLWLGGPHPLSNPHLGPGQPHPQLLKLLEVYRSQPQPPQPVLRLPPDATIYLPSAAAKPASTRHGQLTSPSPTQPAQGTPELASMAPTAADKQGRALTASISNQDQPAPQFPLSYGDQGGLARPAHAAGSGVPAMILTGLNTADPAAHITIPALLTPHNQNPSTTVVLPNDARPGPTAPPFALPSYPQSVQAPTSLPLPDPPPPGPPVPPQMPWPFGPYKPGESWPFSPWPVAPPKPQKKVIEDASLVWPTGDPPPWLQPYLFYGLPGQPKRPASGQAAYPTPYDAVHQGPWTLPAGYKPLPLPTSTPVLDPAPAPLSPLEQSILQHGESSVRVGLMGVYSVDPAQPLPKPEPAPATTSPTSSSVAPQRHVSEAVLRVPSPQWNPNIQYDLSQWPAGAGGPPGVRAPQNPLQPPQSAGPWSASPPGMYNGHFSNIAYPQGDAQAPVLYPYYYNPYDQQQQQQWSNMPGPYSTFSQPQSQYLSPQEMPQQHQSHAWATQEAIAALQAHPTSDYFRQQSSIPSTAISTPVDTPRGPHDAAAAASPAANAPAPSSTGLLSVTAPPNSAIPTNKYYPPVPTLRLQGISHDAPSGPPSACTTTISNLPYDQWADANIGRDSEATIAYIPQWTASGIEASPVQTPRDSMDQLPQQALPSLNTTVPAYMSEASETSSPSSTLTAVGMSGAASAASKPGLLPTLNENDLPPPAFDKPRTPRMGHSRLSHSTSDGLDAGSTGRAQAEGARVGVAGLPANASAVQKITNSAKRLFGKIGGLFGSGGDAKKEVETQEQDRPQQDIMPIGILPTSLEVVTEEQEEGLEAEEEEEEVEVGPQQVAAAQAFSPGLGWGQSAMATQPHDSDEEARGPSPSRSGSPARRMLGSVAAAFGSVKSKLGGKSGQTAPALESAETRGSIHHTTTSYPVLEDDIHHMSDDMIAHHATAGEGLVQHADLIGVGESSTHSSLRGSEEGNPLMQTFKRRGQPGGLRTSGGLDALHSPGAAALPGNAIHVMPSNMDLPMANRSSSKSPSSASEQLASRSLAGHKSRGRI